MSDINLVIYPQGPARCVIQLDLMVDMLSVDQLIHLNNLVTTKLLTDLTKDNDND